MRADVDGSNIETVVDTSQGDPRPGPGCNEVVRRRGRRSSRRQALLDTKGTRQRRQGPAFSVRASKFPVGRRRLIERISKFSPRLPSRSIWSSIWTIASFIGPTGVIPRGNTVNRAPMDADQTDRPTPEIVLTHLMEGIGIALDLRGGRMFITDFGGNVLAANLDGSDEKALLVAQGNLTGIAYSETL